MSPVSMMILRRMDYTDLQATTAFFCAAEKVFPKCFKILVYTFFLLNCLLFLQS